MTFPLINNLHFCTKPQKISIAIGYGDFFDNANSYTNSKLKVSKEFASKSMVYDFYANSCHKFIWNSYYSSIFALSIVFLSRTAFMLPVL
jgi:hypothetical protein